MMDFIKQSWKAVVALLVPILFGAATEAVAALAQWVQDVGGVWSGVALGVLSSVAVWLKRNAPAPTA